MRLQFVNREGDATVREVFLGGTDPKVVIDGDTFRPAKPGDLDQEYPLLVSVQGVQYAFRVGKTAGGQTVAFYKEDEPKPKEGQ